MGRIRVNWSFATAGETTNLAVEFPDAIRGASRVPPGCSGLFFRALFIDDQDAGGFLSSVTLDQVRRARNEPDNSLLFRPKPAAERSVGVLRIVRPKGISEELKAQIGGRISTDPSTGKAVITPTLGSAFTQDFEVLLESTEFVLEDVQEQMAERFQLQETFGNFTLNLFGKRAEMFQYSGSLLNGQGNLQWRNQFLNQYEKFLRGTKCAELKARAYLLYDDVMREGYILSAAVGQSSAVDSVAKFTFTMLITGKRILGFVPETRSAQVSLAKAAPDLGDIAEFEFVKTTAVPGFRPVDRGPEPSGAVKQLMIRRTLSAIELMKKRRLPPFRLIDGGRGIAMDLLADFVPDEALPARARAEILGNTSVAEVDIERLIAGDLLVSDLRLGQAVQIARLFAKTDRANLIGTDLAAELSSLANFLAPDSSSRIATPVPEKTDFSKFATGKYVLQKELDEERLTALITLTEPIRNFDDATANAKAAEAVTVETLSRFLKEDSESYRIASASKALMAAFAFITNPQTDARFLSVTSNLPKVTEMTGDSISFIKKQKLKAFKAALDGLIPDVKTSFLAAYNDIRQSDFMTMAGAELGRIPELVPLSEYILEKTTTFSKGGSQAGLNNAKFVHAMAVYVAGIAGEFIPGAIKASTDAFGGTVRPVPGGDGLGGAYFTQQTFDNLTLRQDNEQSKLIAITFAGGIPFVPAVGPSSATVSKFLMIPITTTGSVFVESSGSTIVKFREIRRAATGDLADLHLVGIVPVAADVVAELESFSKPVFWFVGQKRRSAVDIRQDKAYLLKHNASADSVFNIGGTSFALSSEEAGGPHPFGIGSPANTSAAIHINGGIPVNRSYLGGKPLTYNEGSLEAVKIAAIDGVIGAIERGFSAAFASAISSVGAFISGDKSLSQVVDDNELRKITDELAIANFEDVPEISLPNGVLKTIGVTTGNYLDMAHMVGVEKVMANKLVDLQLEITAAVQKAQANGPGFDAIQNDRVISQAECPQP